MNDETHSADGLRRYRVSVIAKFKRTIEAVSAADARRAADDLVLELRGVPPDDGIEEPEWAWNVIELLG